MTRVPKGPRWLAAAPDDEAERQPITRRRIVEAALRLVDERGLDALTIRALAKELGASPMAPYTHVRNKDELLDLMLDHVLGEIDLGPATGKGDWAARLRTMFCSYHLVLLAHPGIARVYSEGVKLGPNGLRAMEAVLSVLRRAGLTPPAAAGAFFALLNYTIGFHQIGRVDAVASDDAGSRRRAEPAEDRLRYFTALAPEEVPTVVSLAPHLGGTRPGRRFEYGLDLLLAGVRATAPVAADC